MKPAPKIALWTADAFSNSESVSVKPYVKVTIFTAWYKNSFVPYGYFPGGEY